MAIDALQRIQTTWVFSGSNMMVIGFLGVTSPAPLEVFRSSRFTRATVKAQHRSCLALDVPARKSAQMLARKPKMLVTVALANKMARVVWALLVKGGIYRAPATAA
jgi:hypothetical protein